MLFLKDGKVFLTYSGGSANGYTYAVGLFTANEEDGTPDFELTTEQELQESLRHVKMKLRIKAE